MIFFSNRSRRPGLRDTKGRLLFLCRNTYSLWSTLPFANTDISRHILVLGFLDKGSSPSLCASIDAYDFLYWNYLKCQSIIVHGSYRVDIWISHLKIQQIAICINMSSGNQTANRIGCRYPVLPLPNGCTQYPWPGATLSAGDRTTYGFSG
jgi:hypothetical protein